MAVKAPKTTQEALEDVREAWGVLMGELKRAVMRTWQRLVRWLSS